LRCLAHFFFILMAVMGSKVFSFLFRLARCDLEVIFGV
jgi:hypothetical protein